MRAGFREKSTVSVAYTALDQRPGPANVRVQAGVGVFVQAAGKTGLRICPTALPSPQAYKPTGLRRVESATSRTRSSETRLALAQAETAPGASAKSRPEKHIGRS